MDTLTDFMENRNTASSVKELKSNIQKKKKKKKMKNDQLETECYVEEIKGKKERGIEKNHEDYKKVLQYEKGSDVTFFVRGEEFKGHRSIFKEQCTIFASMLQEEIVKTSGLVVIDDSDPNLFATIFQNLYTGYIETLTASGLVVIDNSDPNLFAIFHQYLYIGHVKTLTTKNVFGLYSIAHKYGTQKLETDCIQYMKSILSLDTICDILAFSFQHQIVELVELASDFFYRNVSEIVTTSEWQVFEKENYTAANELLVEVNKRGFSQFSKSDFQTKSLKNVDHRAGTSDFQTMSKNELQHRAGPSDLISRKPNETCEVLTGKLFGEHSIGELSVESHPSKEIKWKIPDFFALTEEIDYCIYSPLFSLANSTWCLKMFPNGQKKENSDGCIDLLLVRLYSQDSDNLVWYKLGIMTCTDGIYVCCKDSNIFKESNVEWGVAHLLKRSWTVDHEILIAKDGIVTVFCGIQVVENQASNHLKLCKLSVKSPLLKMPEKLKIGELSEEFFLTKVISWKVLDAFALLEEREYHSPPFNFENAVWCLQMYLIDDKTRGDGKWFGLKLVRLHSNILQHEIYFTLGIKNNLGQICKSFNDKHIFGEKTVKWKDVQFLTQSIKQKCTITASENCVTAFCQMFLKKDYQRISPDLPLSTELVMDTVIDLKQDKNNASSFSKLKSNIQKISSEDDGKAISKTLDELEKKKMSDDQFEMEKHEAELAVNKSQQDYKKTLRSEKECDVTFFVRGEEFQGNTAIFKEHSTFFASMFQEEIVKTSGLIVVDDCDPCFFAIFIQYLYTGHVETLTRDNVCSLYTLAQKYGAEKLLTECLQYMKNVLSLDTACDN